MRQSTACRKLDVHVLTGAVNAGRDDIAVARKTDDRRRQIARTVIDPNDVQIVDSVEQVEVEADYLESNQTIFILNFAQFWAGHVTAPITASVCRMSCCAL